MRLQRREEDDERMATSFAAGPVTLRQWEKLTKALLFLDGVLAAVYVFSAVVGVTVTLSGAEQWALTALSLVSLPVMLRWVNQARQLLQSFGDDAKRMGHWSSTASFVLVVAAYGVFFLDHKTPLFPALLAVATVPAVLTVLHTRTLVRGVAAGEIAAQSPDLKPQPPAANDNFW